MVVLLNVTMLLSAVLAAGSALRMKVGSGDCSIRVSASFSPTVVETGKFIRLIVSPILTRKLPSLNCA